ncbi:Glycosyltransferase [Gaiella occulta]|uniref:Glycosyltransferase n=1 Tax=Gaiella occulta TaxID=1002870 RepID=A0A7M2YVZ7_9ACTN|nr:glycosyltransferase family 1 protein [Gaiella occulta]RDI74303.1 Glycosyltransferase [Gaiella occulta]
MRVALSMLTLVPGAMGGSETYARSLCRALAARRLLDVTAFVPAIARDAGEGLPTEVVDEYRSGTTAAAKLRGVARALASPGAMRLRYRGIDVVHYPFTVPLPRLPARVVITLHDVQHLDVPGLFSRAERAYRKVAYDRAARGADIVVVPTAFVRGRALEKLGLEESRVRVIHHGVDHAQFRPDGSEREPFLLYPARTWPHKNHRRLLEAFALLRRDRPELRLVLTGGGSEALAGPPGVEARGAVPQAELVGLYRRAACLVFPSLYEGFGAPPLEAMACGTPVAASNAASLPEVCGDAAVLFEPDDPRAIAAGVEAALARADELARRGLERAAAFTWDAAAQRHEDAYRSLSTRS